VSRKIVDHTCVRAEKHHKKAEIARRQLTAEVTNQR